MIRSFFLTFFTVGIITLPFLFPGYGIADCDFEKMPISLKTVNKPVTEILKDISKQTKYTIEIQGSNTLDNKKSIELDQAPLNLTLNRLLKGLNYSIICNNEQKMLTLVFLDKKGIQPARASSIVSSSKNAASSESSSMDDITTAFEEYKKIEGTPSPVPEYQSTSMDSVTDAFKEYNNIDNLPKEDLEQEKQKTSMDVVTESFKGYDAKSSLPAQTTKKVETSMDGATNAFEAYENKNTQPTIEPGNQETSMDEVTNVFEEYNTNAPSLP